LEQEELEKVVFRKIAVIGFGTMGQGIAQTISQKGILVIIVEKNTKALKKGLSELSMALDKEIERAVSIGMGIIAMKTCSAGPLKKEEATEATFSAGLEWILNNKNISTMAVWMGNFREIDENIQMIKE
jgi:glutamate dehydrogenase/leucine dehydrogenase